MIFQEPVMGAECEFKLIPRDELVMSTYQRDFSSDLVGRITDSVAKGFLVPVIVVASGENYEVIDGQHRLLSLDRHPKPEMLVPSIIVPPYFKALPLMLNVEKGDNIRDKATKIHALYLDVLAEHPGESEATLVACVSHQPYLFTMAFAYKESLVDSPSLVEPIVKKLDKAALGESLEIAVAIRRHRGGLVKQLEDTIVELAKANGIRDFNLKKSMLSQTSMEIWGRARNINEDFNDAMAKVTELIAMTDWSHMTKF